jgi:hypothetical protein
MKNQTNNAYGSGHFTVDLAGAANKFDFARHKNETVHNNPEIAYLFQDGNPVKQSGKPFKKQKEFVLGV